MTFLRIFRWPLRAFAAFVTSATLITLSIVQGGWGDNNAPGGWEAVGVVTFFAVIVSFIWLCIALSEIGPKRRAWRASRPARLFAREEHGRIGVYKTGGGFVESHIDSFSGDDIEAAMERMAALRIEYEAAHERKRDVQRLVKVLNR